MVWAETASTGSGNVRRVDRVGIRVYLDVGPGGEAPSDFAIGPGTAGGSTLRPVLPAAAAGILALLVGAAEVRSRRRPVRA